MILIYIDQPRGPNSSRIRPISLKLGLGWGAYGGGGGGGLWHNRAGNTASVYRKFRLAEHGSVIVIFKIGIAETHIGS